MSDYREVIAIVEGPTEQRFIKQVLAPYLLELKVFLTPIILDKPGEKGGDVKFARAQNDIERHIKQRSDTWVTTFVDYYGIRGDWPGYAESKAQTTHVRKAEVMNAATAREVARLFPLGNTTKRFVPYVSMHEIEALYFSDPVILAEKLGINLGRICSILKECGEPEKINDSPHTAPSKRLQALSARFKKTSTGITIASEIGIPKMRAACPIFDGWLTTLENL
jgi:hypothetical protein